MVIDVAEGKLPEVVLNWPAALVGDAELEGPATAGFQPLGDGANRELHVRFARAIDPGQQIRISLRSAVSPASPKSVVGPVVSVWGADALKRYFGLPPITGGEWNWRRAKPAVAPASIEGLLANWPSAQLLEANGAGRPLVRWTADANGQATYRIPLANVQLHVASGGTAALHTELMVPAFGARAIQIAVPEGQKLSSARVDGRPALVMQSAGGIPRLVMPDPAVPHVVELVTVCQAWQPPAGLEVPNLLVDSTPCTIEHRLWSVHSSTGRGYHPISDAERLPPADLAALRANQLLEALGCRSKSDRAMRPGRGNGSID